jgi:alpha-galactosidase
VAKNITMIGGGSSSFVPPLLRRLIESTVLRDATLTLMDVDAARLEVMERLGHKVVESEDSPLTVRATTDMREALTDADFVISAISVGGMTAWESDMEIPAKYGLVMHVADSIGPGGVMRTLRNAPISRAIAETVAEVAPGAWIFNYTNPTAVEGMAMRTVPGVNVVSLCSCNVHVKSPDWLAEQTGVSPDEIAMPPVVGGINHCAGVMELRLKDGRDALDLARATVTNEIQQWALQIYGMLPYCWSHWTEFHPGMQRLVEPYAGTAQGVAMKYGIRTHDMEEQRARPAELAELADAWTAPGAGAVRLADLPMGDEDEGVEVVDIIESMIAHRPHTYVVNVPNHGAIPNLPDDAVVEVSARVDAYGVRPIYAGPLPDALASLLRGYVALQRQMVCAALSGDRDDVYRALLLDPTTQSILDIDQIGQLCDELLAANTRWLPQFSPQSSGSAT